jgi:hypothetical protein
MPRRASTTIPLFRRLPATVLLVLALLWAQLLGLAHGVLHAGVAAHEPAALAQTAPTSSGLLTHLLAPAGDDGECRLYDQLGHGAPLPPMAVLPVAAPLPLLAWVALPAPRPQACAAFSARAPPLSR